VIVPAVRVGDPAGPYRRRVRMVAVEPDAVVADLEDDFHRFRVTVHHDGNRVVDVRGEGLRFPWSTCADAAGQLHELDGMPLSTRCSAVAHHGDPRANCTHMFDLAGLAVAHAARGGERRQYDVELPPTVDGRTTPRLWRDGELTLAWTLDSAPGVGRGLVDPVPPFDAAPWRGGFMRWADATLEPDEAEAAIVLRRACEIGMGRGMDLDRLERAEQLAGVMLGVCYTMRPGTIAVALRNKLTARDFAEHPDALLSYRDD
jgi:hypothetical protein